MRCQVFGSPSATVSNAKPPAILISASSLPKCAADGVDRLLGLRRIGQIDAAKFDAGRPSPAICDCGVIHAGHPRAAGQRGFRDHPAERARGAGHDNDFSVHGDDLRMIQQLCTPDFVDARA